MKSRLLLWCAYLKPPTRSEFYLMLLLSACGGLMIEYAVKSAAMMNQDYFMDFKEIK